MKTDEIADDKSFLLEQQERIIQERTEDLRASDEKYRTLIESANDAVFIHEIGEDGMPGTFVEVNELACRRLGYSREELARMSPLELDDPRYRDRIGEAMERLLKDGHALFETAQIARDGQSIPVEVSTRVLERKGKRLLFSIVRDISERKRAEQAQLRLNRELMAISSCHEVMIRATDEETLLREICRIICAEAGYRMAWVGYAEHDEAKSVRPVASAGVEDGYLIDAHITWADTEFGRGPTGKAIRSGECVCVQDFTADSQAAPWRERALQRGYRSSIALPLKDENAGTFGVINIYATEPDTFTPDEMRLLGKLADDLAFGITTLRTRAQRDQSNRDLEKGNELLRAIIDAAPTAIIGLDLDGRVQTVWNQAAEKMLGWSAREAMGNFLPSVPLYKHEEFQRFRETIRSGKGLNGVEVRRQRRDGTPIDYSIYASPLHDLDGRIIGNIAVLVDITERKRVDELLRESLIRLQTMVRNAPIILYGFDRKGIFTLSEGKGLAGMGLKPGEIVGLSVFDVYRDYPDCLENFRRALAGEAFKAPVHFGDHVYDAYHEPLFGDDGVYAGTFGVVVDVTERTQAEEALRESEEKFRVLAETSPAAIILHQGERFIYTNPAATRISGYSEAELLEMNFWEWSSEEYRETIRERSHARLRCEAVPPQYEHKFFTKNGEGRWVIVSAGVTEYRGRPTVIATLLDITPAKEAEEKIRSSLAEKEVLLKEVHHRVKNNLQIISTLLDLQFEKIEDEHALNALKESQDRIKAMALLHEMLYQSSDLASIDFAKYIEKLALFLFNSHMADQEQITLNIDVGHINLDIDRAIPCGLIVNELVTNALKHAFPSGRQGDIAIRLQYRDDGRMRLTVSDNGTGLPPGVDFRNTNTLGLQLVNMLTRQLAGDIELQNENGASFTLSFRSTSGG
jgi:PAS domain S-box-containing protein